MGKFAIFVFALMIFIGIGIAVHRGSDDSDKNQKQVPSVVSGEESAGEAASIEELASRGEKVSFDEALAKIEQANVKIKEHSEIFSIGKITERFKKDGLTGLVAHFRGGESENQNPRSQLAALAKPTGKGARVQRTEKDNTDSVRLEIERLQKEEEAKRLQQEKTAGKNGQAPQQTVQEKPGEDEKKDFFTELREMWETFKSVLASSE